MFLSSGGALGTVGFHRLVCTPAADDFGNNHTMRSASKRADPLWSHAPASTSGLLLATELVCACAAEAKGARNDMQYSAVHS